MRINSTFDFFGLNRMYCRWCCFVKKFREPMMIIGCFILSEKGRGSTQHVCQIRAEDRSGMC